MFASFPVAYSRPLAYALEDWDYRFASLGEFIFDVWRNLIVLDTVYEAVLDELFESGGKDSIGNVDHFISYSTVSQDLLFIEDTYYTGFPFPSENLEPVLKWTADIIFKFLLVHGVILVAFCCFG